MAENVTRVTAVNFNHVASSILERMDKKSKVTAGKIGQAVLQDVFGGIIEDTPINDADPDSMGRTKANWQLTTGSPASGFLPSKKPRRTRRGLGIPRSFKQIFGKDWFLANNVPWINFLEFGGYPSNPTRGTWNKSMRAYEIRSAGGFSKQAPQGMFRKNVAKFGQYVDAAVGKFGNK